MLPGQLDLLEFAETRATYPDAPGHRGVTTQIAAADKIAPIAGAMRKRVFDHIEACGPQGATRPEIAAALNMKLQTVCGRVRELVLDGRCQDTEETRDACKVVRRA